MNRAESVQRGSHGGKTAEPSATRPGQWVRFAHGLIFPLFLAVAGILLVLISTAPHGIGMSTDPVGYLSVARNVAAGRGWIGYFAGFPDTPLLYWPPLFPALLALLGRVGIEPMLGAQLLNSALFGASVGVGTRWLQRHLHSPPLIVLGGFSMLLAAPLFRTAITAYSEPLFVLLVLLFLVGLERYLDEPATRAFSLFTLAAALAMLTRYIGVILLPVGMIALLWRITPRREAARAAVAYALLSWLPLGAWWLRNTLISGTITGPRGRSTLSLVENGLGTLHIFVRWLFPQTVPPELGVVALLVGVGVLTWGFLRLRSTSFPEALNVLLPSGLLSLLYPPFLILSASVVAYNVMLERFYVPLYIPLLWLLLYMLDRWLEAWSAGGGSKGMRQVLLGGLVLWLLFSGIQVAQAARHAIRDGAGPYNEQLWRASELLAHLRGFPLDGAIYSNAPYALYLHADIAATISPRQFIPPIVAGDPEEDLKAFMAAISTAEQGYLVWFENSFTSGDASLFEVETLETRLPLQIEVAQQFSDGIIYTVRPR